MKAVLCPVCNGTGKVKKKTCYGCDGKGWVEVKEDFPRPRPYPDDWNPWKWKDFWESTWGAWWREK